LDDARAVVGAGIVEDEDLQAIARPVERAEHVDRVSDQSRFIVDGELHAHQRPLAGRQASQAVAFSVEHLFAANKMHQQEIKVGNEEDGETTRQR
jgi:hypothetical protein